MSITFSDFEIELDNIVYNDKCEKIIADNFKEWINRKRYTTFPRKKNKWLQIFRTHSNIYNIEFILSIPEIINNLNKKKIPYTYKHIYKSIQDFIDSKNDFNIDKYHFMLKNYATHYDIKTPEFILNSLIKHNCIFELNENDFIINNDLLITYLKRCGSKRKLIIEDDI